MSRLIDLTYNSSTGESFPLVATNMYLKNASIHAFEWKPSSTAFKYGDLLKTFTKDAIYYDVTIAFNGALATKENIIKNFHDAIETDILTQTPGTLTYNGYTIDCYIISSKIYPNDSNTRTLDDCTIYCPYPFWLKETKYTLSMGGTALLDAANFELNLPLNLGVSGYQRTITVDSAIPYEFRLEINGAITNPSLTINGHIYNVGVTVPNTAKLIISSIEKTDIEKSIYVLYPSGNTVNVFDKRNRESYIFEPILGKTITISSAQIITFDLYLIERRSEPLWT